MLWQHSSTNHDEENQREDDKHEKEENGLNKRVEEKDIGSTQKCECASDNEQSSDSEGDSQSNFYPESDFYEMSSSDEGSVPSNFEDWYNNKKARLKARYKCYSD